MTARRSRSSTVGALHQELFELVDDQQDALIVALSAQSAVDRCRDPVTRRPGQTGTLDLGQQILPRPGHHGQPPVTARQFSRRQRAQHTRLDQGRLPRPGRPEQHRQLPLLGQVRHDLPYRVLPPFEPLGVLSRERLQPPIGAHLPLGQLRHDLPQDLRRSDVRDAVPPLVLVRSGDLGQHPDDQAGHLIEDRPAAEPGGEVVRGGQLQMRAPAL